VAQSQLTAASNSGLKPSSHFSHEFHQVCACNLGGRGCSEPRSCHCIPAW
uniref:Uncharacterized protein n=1 Tax=Macaca fascicularis TaxID=9541 RepID=A0A7N9D3B4_MACFA